MNYWRSLSHTTRCFLIGVAIGPAVWLFMVAFLLGGQVLTGAP